jgi:hypothetical protein
MTMSIVGRTYYERGRPVLIVVQWRTGDDPGAPRSVPKTFQVVAFGWVAGPA